MNSKHCSSTLTVYEYIALNNYISDHDIQDCQLISFDNEKIIKLPHGHFSLKSLEAFPFLNRINNKEIPVTLKSLESMKITGKEPLTLKLLKQMYLSTSQERETPIERTNCSTESSTASPPQPETPPPPLTEAQKTTDTPPPKTATQPQFNDNFVSHCLKIKENLCERIKNVVDYIKTPENDAKCKKAIKAFKTGIWPKEVIPQLIEKAYNINKNSELGKNISEHKENNDFIHGCTPIDKTGKPILTKKIHRTNRNEDIYFLLEHNSPLNSPLRKFSNLEPASKALEAFEDTLSIMSHSCIIQIALFRAMYDHLGKELFNGIFSPDKRIDDKAVFLLADFSASPFTSRKNLLYQYGFLKKTLLSQNHNKFLKGTIYVFETTHLYQKKELFAFCSKSGRTKKGINDDKIFIHPYLTPELIKDGKYILEQLPDLSTYPNCSYTFQYDRMQKCAKELRFLEPYMAISTPDNASATFAGGATREASKTSVEASKNPDSSKTSTFTESTTPGKHTKQRKKAKKNKNSARIRPKEKKHLNSNPSPESPLVSEASGQQGSHTLMPFFGQTDTTNNTNSSLFSLTSESKSAQKLSLNAKHDRTDQKAISEDFLSNPTTEDLYKRMRSVKRAIIKKSIDHQIKFDVKAKFQEIQDLINVLREQKLLTEQIQKHIDDFIGLVTKERYW